MSFETSDITGEDPGKGKKSSSPGFELSDITGSAAGTRNRIAGTLDPNTHFTDYDFQPKTGADNNLLRAEDQGFWESTGKTLGNTIANIPLGIAEGVGFLGTLFDTGDDRDYSNALTKKMQEWKNPFGEVYREHPDQTFDLGDSAWWFNNMGQLVESAAAFGIEGAGIAKIFGNLAKVASVGAKSARVANGVAQGLTAGTLAYVEGAMSGAQIYESAYNSNYMKLYQQGMNPSEADEQARHRASQAAAATVQLNVLMNTALNLTALTPLFREPDQAITSWFRANGARKTGETVEQWTARIGAALPEGAAVKKLLGWRQGAARLGIEAAQEGVEEVNTQYAEGVGKGIGEGENKDVAGNLFNIGRYFDTVTNQEGALNFALGALGGVAQTVILDHMPVHKVVKYGSDGKPLMTEAGKPQTERISSHTMNNRMSREYFDNIKDALSKDMNWFADKSKTLEKAMLDKDMATVARTKADLLSVHNLRAISMGLGDVWENEYKEIGALDNSRSLGEQLQPQLDALTKQMQDAFNSGDTDTANQLNQQRIALQEQQAKLINTTDAMQKGFALDKSDNDYKTKAGEAIQNLHYLTNMYQQMQDKFGYDEATKESGLAEHMFYRHANQYLHKQELDRQEAELMKMKSQIDAMNLNPGDDLLVGQAREFAEDRDTWQTTAKKINNDIARFNDAIKNNDAASIQKLLDKYHIPYGPNAAKNLNETLGRISEDMKARAEFSTKELNDSIEVWKVTNPDKKVEDVLRKAAERPVLMDMYKERKAYLRQGRAEYDVAREQLAKDSTSKAISQFVKDSKPKKDDSIDKAHIEAYGKQIDREIAAQMDVKQKAELTTRTASRINQLQQRNQELTDLLQENRRLHNNTRAFRDFNKRSELKKSRQAIEEELSQNRYELSLAQTNYSALTSQVQQAAQENTNVTRKPDIVQQPGTTEAVQAEGTQPEITVNDNLPFDFSTEIVPDFTTIEEGDDVFSNLVGGSDAATAMKQFIQLRKDAPVDVLVHAFNTMLDRTNQAKPTPEDMARFVVPYLTALKQVYMQQVPDATQEYQALRSFLQPIVLASLDALEGEFMEHGFSYDRTNTVLDKHVKNNDLDAKTMPMIVQRLREYIASKTATAEQTTPTAKVEQNLESTPVAKEFNEEPTTKMIQPDTEATEYSNAALDMGEVEASQKQFVGASNIEGVRSNYNTNEYREFEVNDEVRIESDYKTLDKKLNTDVLIPGVIIPGDEISLVIDEKWVGEINTDTSMSQDEYGNQMRRQDAFQNYLEDGKIGIGASASHPRGAFANVPIKIVHTKTGKVIGYFPRADWITARYDTSNYRNIVDTYQDEETEVTDNVARQYMRVMKVREAVVKAWNTNKDLKVKTVISKRGTGHIFLNREVNNNTGRTKLTPRSAKNMLPDPALEIAIMKDGNAFVASGILSEKPMSNMAGYLKSASSLPVAMLPSPDGTYIPTPLYTQKLGDNPSTLNTVVKAIETYLRVTSGTFSGADTTIVNRIKEATGFDLSSERGLRGFIQQYFTFTTKFGEKDTVITPSEAGKGAIPSFMLDIPFVEPGEASAFIKAGVSFSGNKPVYARLVNGTLHPDFEDTLRAGLQDRFKSVIFAGQELRGINSTGEFKSAIIRKDGVVQVTTHASYNDFVKANAQTFAYGLHQVNGKYVYTANSTVELDYNQVLKGAPTTVTAMVQEAPKTQEPDTEELDLFGDLLGSNNMMELSAGTVIPLSIPIEGEPVSLELLENTRNLTPEAERNTKTPETVLQELLSQGITVLAPGHNPFKTC